MLVDYYATADVTGEGEWRQVKKWRVQALLAGAFLWWLFARFLIKVDCSGSLLSGYVLSLYGAFARQGASLVIVPCGIAVTRYSGPGMLSWPLWGG